MSDTTVTTEAPTTTTTTTAPVTTAPVTTQPPAVTTTEPPVTTAAPPATTTLATGTEPPTTTTPPASTDFPTDWRERMAGEDKTFLGQLKRYASPADVGKWVRSTQLKISAGELRSNLPADATPEQIAEYRKSNGIPEAADGYVAGLKLPDGMVLGESDKPIVSSLAEVALAKNMSPDAFSAVVSKYYELQDQIVAQRQEADQTNRISAQQTLIQEWGPDFKANMNALKSFWGTAPQGVADVLLTARTPDGKIIGDLPQVASFIANLAREMNPAATLLPAGSDQSAAGITARKTEIERSMYIGGKPNPQYFGGPLEKEYRDLVSAEERMKTRAA